jgi:hypothetical protein
MSNQTLPQTTSASQIINCILTGIKLDLGSRNERSALTEAASYRFWLKPETVRATEDGNWIEAYDGYGWSRVTAQTMTNWLRVENLPEAGLAVLGGAS